jgi:hypothetical protein
MKAMQLVPMFDSEAIALLQKFKNMVWEEFG